ncbi:MAG TPA: chemotaxis protein CheA [Gemmatimonas sp.]|nr:chemotaxis protein CheA [Gemmatimonas sp.]
MSHAPTDASRYADLFRVEARDHLAELDTALLALEQVARDDADGDTDRDAVRDERRSAERDRHVATVFRAVHTLKGMAGAMGYRAVERISHALESLLDRARAGSITLEAYEVALLFDATDALSAAVSDSADGIDDPEREEFSTILRRLGSVTSRPHTDDVFASVVAVDIPTDARQARTVSIALTADCPLKGVRAMLVSSRLRALGDVGVTTPPQARWNDDDFDGAFTLSFRGSATADEIAAAARAAGEVARVDVLAPDAHDDRAPKRGGLPGDERAGASGERRVAGDATRHVRIDLRRLDMLVDLTGELVITRDRLLREADRAVERGADRALARAVQDAARIVTALQHEVLHARMVPVGQVFDRFPRVVRDLARDLGKDVQFVTEGRDIELDRSLLDAIGDPILHLLRNALDHGLETRDVRRLAGKPAAGRLVLRAARDRASVVLQVEDDGRGIDRKAVLQRAREKGLLGANQTEGGATVDDDRLLQVLAHSGLSTARAVTAVSGRGVGVDVVATRVRALGGLLSLETIEGHGTVFTMRLPATLAITKALLVEIGGDTYAIPATHVVEAIEFDPAALLEESGRELLAVRGARIPVLRLRQHFGYPGGAGEGYVAVVDVCGRRTALVVDAMIAQQDVVVKPFDAARGGAPWFSGATVLGDGTPSLIVDLGMLV